MTATTAAATAPTGVTAPRVLASYPNGVRRNIPLARLARVELRKCLDTRSGFWLLASIGLASILTTGAVIAWAPNNELTYSQFTLAIGVPISIILPIIAALSVTAEWSQRSGLATFTLVPHRSRVLLAKVSAVLLIAAASTATAFAVGALGNLISCVPDSGVTRLAWSLFGVSCWTRTRSSRDLSSEPVTALSKGLSR